MFCDHLAEREREREREKLVSSPHCVTVSLPRGAVDEYVVCDCGVH